MRNTYQLKGIVFLCLCCSALMYASCAQPNGPATDNTKVGTPDDGDSQGQVWIRVGEAAQVQALYPELDGFSNYVLDFVREDGKTAASKTMQVEETLTVTLNTGEWEITAKGFIDPQNGKPSYAAAQGSIRVEVQADGQTDVMIVLDKIISKDGEQGSSIEDDSSQVIELLPVKEFSQVADLKEYLDALPTNTEKNPYPVKMQDVDLSSTAKTGNTLKTLYDALSQFVTLDLSGCTGDNLVPASTAQLENRAKIVSIILPGSLTTIKDNGFSGYKALVSVDMPRVTTIGYNAFTDCGNLKTLSMPKLRTIGYGAFKKCDQIETLSMPELITIESFTGTPPAPDHGAFRGCSALVSVDCPKLETVGTYAFYGCTSLVSISLPTAKVIKNTAFKGCTKLELVELPQVTFIGSSAFTNDTALRRLVLGKVPPEVEGGVFEKSTPTEGIYVPADAVGAYNAPGLNFWSTWSGSVNALNG